MSRQVALAKGSKSPWSNVCHAVDPRFQTVENVAVKRGITKLFTANNQCCARFGTIHVPRICVAFDVSIRGENAQNMFGVVQGAKSAPN